jgi:RNA recognition motif-containing protein
MKAYFGADTLEIYCIAATSPTTEAGLKAEFARHGPIRSISLIKDLAGRSRGYAFIEYERTGDM